LYENGDVTLKTSHREGGPRGQGPEPWLLVDRPWATFQNTFTYLAIPSTTVSHELYALLRQGCVPQLPLVDPAS
jgi:hypothetical protein